MKILFITKKRASYGYPEDYMGKYTGLYNSGVFTLEMLKSSLNAKGKVVQVTDNNDIDREVAQYKPTHVILEALWVVPEKMPILMKLHPRVKWIVRIHSKTPFLAMEGIALEWIKGYLSYKSPKLQVSFNNEETNKNFTDINLPSIYLPNLYNPDTKIASNKRIQVPTGRNVINVGCFGAVRPMKNHLNQAIAAIKWAKANRYQINFHINTGRIEQKGDTILKNLRALFKDTPHFLIEHGWLDHKDFLKLVSKMDVGLQVSLSESFNVVAADFVSQRVPIVVAPDIAWMPKILQANPNSVDDMAEKMNLALFFNKYIPSLAFSALDKYNENSLEAWRKLW